MGVTNREFGSSTLNLDWNGQSYKFIFSSYDIELTAEMMRARAAMDIKNQNMSFGWDFPLIKERDMSIDIKGVVPADRTSDDVKALFESAMIWATYPSDPNMLDEASFIISSGYAVVSGFAVVDTTELNYGGEAGEGSLRLKISGAPTVGIIGGP